ncbi:MAG: hypothetical protein N3B12_00640 [Armatimonadetes bacterium]|nr:hypothetical protein [Armatimonadota bacterium]
MLIIGVALAAVFLIAVLHWWAEGIYEASDAIVLAAVFCGLIFGLFAASSVWEFFLAFVPLVATGAYVLHSYRTGGLKAYLRKVRDECIRVIESDPRNIGARERLARTLHDLGELDQAIDEMEVAIGMGAGMESRYALNKWIKERHLRDSTASICHRCMTENQIGSSRCSRCGAELPLQTPLAKWITGGRPARTRYYLILITGLATLCISVLLLPIEFAFIPLAACLIALAGWKLLAPTRS